MNAFFPTESPQDKINEQLLEAAKNGDLPAAQRLIPLSSNLFNPPGAHFHTALEEAAKHGHTQIVRSILCVFKQTKPSEKGPSELLLPLYASLLNGHLACAEELATALPAHVFSQPEWIAAPDVLLRAAIVAHRDAMACLRLVFDLLGPDLVAQFANDALRFAAERQKPDLLRLLLPFADPNDQNKAGETALICSCAPPRGGGGELIDGQATELLLPVSDPTLLTRQGNTAWMLAAMHEAWPCLDALGADQLRREPHNDNLRVFLRERQDRLPKCAAYLEAESLQTALGKDKIGSPVDMPAIAAPTKRL